MSRVWLWLCAAVIALALAAAPTIFDELDDHSAEHDEAAKLEAAQNAQDLADSLCQAARGPHTDGRWTPEGHLVCRMRNKYVRIEL